MEEKEKKKASANEQQSANVVNIKDLYTLCLQHWWWFIVSLLVCLTVATYYLRQTHIRAGQP